MAMAMIPNSPALDPQSGFCSQTKIYNSIRPYVPLPPESIPLSVTDYIFSLLPSPESTSFSAVALIDAATAQRIFYPDLVCRVQSLAASLQHKIGLSKGDSAFILSPNSIHIPILYLSLLSIGVIVSPSNPTSTRSEISHQIDLCKPAIAFATSDTAHKVPSLRYSPIILDSAEFESMMEIRSENLSRRVDIWQYETAAIMYSSGTTGKIKGVELTHRNFIAYLAAGYASRPVRSSPAVALCLVPYFHMFGLPYFLSAISWGESLVSMRRFDMRSMMRAIQEFRVTKLGTAPPVIVAMVKDGDPTRGYDTSSLEVVGTGGAPIAKSVIQGFLDRFPHVKIMQGLGLTETTGAFSRTIGPEECQVLGTVGRLLSYWDAKIVDPDSGIALPPSMPGELWVRGPCIMKGYVGDKEATDSVLDSEGWLKTGDICYIDNKGFLFYVDRIKELIKYKGYQVAPAELEHVLHSHPAIADAAVVPYPDEEAGQIPMAFVVIRPGSSIGESQIIDFVAKQIAPHKKIRRVSFVPDLPRTATGKLLRRELVKLALSNVSSSSSKL